MNAAVFRLLFDYSAWANAKVWECVDSITQEEFVKPLNYSLGSVWHHLVHIPSVDNRWFSLLRSQDIPAHFDPKAYPKVEQVSLLWQIIYNDVNDYLDNMTDADVNRDISLGGGRTMPAWQVLLHVLNHATDHRAQLLYGIHQIGGRSTELDFVYYLRDEMPLRVSIDVSPDVLRTLFRYDAYATGRLVSEGMVKLSDEQLDRDMGYAHKTIRGQLQHILVGHQYWLERAFDTEAVAASSDVFGLAERLLADATSRTLLAPVEYKNPHGQTFANIRWEMLWHLINHGTDHRAQTLAMLHALGAPTFEQDMIYYFLGAAASD